MLALKEMKEENRKEENCCRPAYRCRSTTSFQASKVHTPVCMHEEPQKWSHNILHHDLPNISNQQQWQHKTTNPTLEFPASPESWPLSVIPPSPPGMVFDLHSLAQDSYPFGVIPHDLRSSKFPGFNAAHHARSLSHLLDFQHPPPPPP